MGPIPVPGGGSAPRRAGRATAALLAALLAAISLAAALATPASAASRRPAVCAPADCPFTAVQHRAFGTPTGAGYWLATTRGGVRAFGDAPGAARAGRVRSVVAVAAVRGGRGRLLATGDGQLRAVGAARVRGSLAGRLAKGERVVALRATRDGRGYWLATDRGRLAAFGSARPLAHGTATLRSGERVTGFDLAAGGRGAWLATGGGRVAALGSARLSGSLAGRLAKGERVVALRATRDGRGYWLATDRGRLRGFGAARRLANGTARPRGGDRVVGADLTRDGRGAWLATAHGRVLTIGRAPRAGSLSGRLARGERAVGVEALYGPVRKPGKASLRIDVSDVPSGRRAAVVVRGPAGFRRVLHRSATIAAATAGRWTVDTPGIRDSDTTAFPAARYTRVRIAPGAAARVRVAYTQVVADTTRVATPSAIVRVTRSGERITAVVRDPAGALRAAKVLSAGPGDATPDGLLVAIDSVRHRGGIATVVGRQASLTDIGPRAELRATPNLSVSREAIASAVGRASADTPGNFDKPYRCTGGIGASVGGGIGMQMKTDMGVSWGGTLHPLTIYAHLIMNVEQQAFLRLAVQGSGTCELDVELLKKPMEFSTFSVPVGPVTVVITPKLNFRITAEGTVKANVSTVVRQDSSLSAGVKWDGSKLSPVKRFDSRFQFQTPAVSADGSMKAAIGPRLVFSIYGAGGPYLSAGVFGKLDVATASDPWWKLSAGLEAGIGLQFKVWKFDFDKGIPDLFSKTWTVAQASGAAPPEVTTASLPQATAGVAYRQTLAGKLGKTPYRWSLVAGSLPAGLALGADGVISGTPARAGTSTFAVQLEDAAKRTAQRTLTLTVAPAPPAPIPPLALSTTSLPDGQIGVGYARTLAASGGTAPYRWSVAAGSLPAGLSLDPATGTLGGTPTATGTATFTVTVQSNDGQSATRAFTLTVAPPTLAVQTTSLAAATVDAPYTATLAASGGTAPYRWSVTSGALPAGLTLDTTTGEVSGTPTTIGSTSITLTVEDAVGGTAARAFTLEVISPDLTITTTSLPDGAQGAPYSAQIRAQGGSAPYNWSAAGLPDGLTLVNGELTGTPTTAGTSEITFTVYDNAGHSATKRLTIAIGNWTPQWMFAVSCATDSFCFATDESNGLLRWDGTSWTRTEPFSQSMQAISCVSESFCVASTDSGSVQRWDGTSWSAPEQLGVNTVRLSCATPDSCVIAGRTGSPERGIAYAWDGTGWTLASTAAADRYIGVDCTARGRCALLTESPTAVQFSDGATWTSAPGWNTGAGAFGIGCSSTSFCLLVGGGTGGDVWNGTAWTGRQTITTATHNKSIVACARTESFCAATGAYALQNPSFVTGDGTTWRTADGVIGAGDWVLGMSCATARFCVAVTGRGRATTWNGTAWSAPRLIAYKVS
jgi:Putative Ig domain